ncbi:LysR family transcriptional regulator [Streptomyces sp. SKN60]|uniref:LysR family transcriptional regulator n=1 Tax=Streptomyces sp. SKN60 TaxID=2855506 RepID=UPI0022468128|nr:LysR family transcriptional regulator [Streptomyces sp. SKN60]
MWRSTCCPTSSITLRNRNWTFRWFRRSSPSRVLRCRQGCRERRSVRHPCGVNRPTGAIERAACDQPPQCQAPPGGGKGVEHVDIDARTLRTFREVTLTGSFTQAARRLGYSQSSVTAQMRALERQVGEPVFERLPSGVRLTRTGTVLCDYARQILTLVGEMEVALRRPAANPPRMTVGVVPALAYGQQLARLTHIGRRLLSGVQLALRVMGTGEVHDAFRAGTIDGALVLTVVDADDPAALPGALTDPLRTPDRADDLTEVRLQEVEFVPVTGVTRMRGAAAAGRQVVIADPDCPSQRWLPEFLRLRSDGPPEIHELGSMAGVRAAAQSGLGCAMLPMALAASPREAGGLRPLPGVPRMRWNACLLSTRGDDRPALDWENLAETLRQATALAGAVPAEDPEDAAVSALGPNPGLAG